RGEEDDEAGERGEIGPARALVRARARGARERERRHRHGGGEQPGEGRVVAGPRIRGRNRRGEKDAGPGERRPAETAAQRESRQLAAAAEFSLERASGGW